MENNNITGAEENLTPGNDEQASIKERPGTQEVMHSGLVGDFSLLQSKVEALSALVNAQAGTIASLKGTIISADAKAALPTIPKEFVERDGKQYRWTMPHFILPGKGKVTAEEAALDEETLKQIFAMEGQGLLVEQH